MTRAEKQMRDINRSKHVPLTPTQIAEKEAQRDQMISKPTPMQLRRAMREKDESYIQKLFNGMTYIQARDVYDNFATPHERRILKPLLDKKRYNLIKRDPSEANTIGR